jgi:hypothetical protein
MDSPRYQIEQYVLQMIRRYPHIRNSTAEQQKCADEKATWIIQEQQAHRSAIATANRAVEKYRLED